MAVPTWGFFYFAPNGILKWPNIPTAGSGHIHRLFGPSKFIGSHPNNRYLPVDQGLSEMGFQYDENALLTIQLS
ncbi:hypothetical protein [Lentilactobacillus parafarraginis]|uniref:hypothetical protein n=1 Tax=Lentilactobacillus parafarraginis TaxID=390842 RepID=UPI0011CBE8BC|nr:hypothetical protein [Lentilactobacillus parafarraginis]